MTRSHKTTEEPLDTDRLLLRGWREADFEAFADFYADADDARYVGGQKNADEAWRHLALQVGHWQLRGFGYWAVEERGTGDFVGSVGLWQSPGWPELELGYWVVERHRGKGYAYEAAQRCREYAESTMGADSLVSYIAPENRPSIALAEKLGATFEGTIELAEHGPHRVYRYF